MEPRKQKQILSDFKAMLDAEGSRLIAEVAGWQADPMEERRDPRFTEIFDGPTPSGGDYYVAYYYNDDGPCTEPEATRVKIIEFLNDGRRINETYALLRKMKIPKIIQEMADQDGANRISYIGKRRGKDAYTLGYVDEEGIIAPTGLPVIHLYDGQTVEVISGQEGLELL